MKRNLGRAILLVCAARIVFGLAEIEKTGNTISGIIGDSVPHRLKGKVPIVDANFQKLSLYIVIDKRCRK